MPGEADITKKVTRVIKGTDKLVRDLKADFANIVTALAETSAALKEIKERLTKPPEE